MEIIKRFAVGIFLVVVVDNVYLVVVDSSSKHKSSNTRGHPTVDNSKKSVTLVDTIQ